MEDIRKHHIYCDESSQTKHRHLVIGASICRASIAPRIAATIEHIIEPHGGTSELKWTKIKRRNLPMYKQVADAFGQLIEAGYLHYYALVVDTSQVDDKTYNDGDSDLGFSKFLYTLLFKFARVYKSDYRFYTFLDERTTKHTPELLQTILNARARRQPRFLTACRPCHGYLRRNLAFTLSPSSPRRASMRWFMWRDVCHIGKISSRENCQIGKDILSCGARSAIDVSMSCGRRIATPPDKDRWWPIR